MRAEAVEDLGAWADFVRTGWTAAALRDVRLRGAWVALLTEGEGAALRATCILRPRGGGAWLLETLVARPRRNGWGSLLMRAAVRWLWDRTDGQFTLGFCWELRGLRGLVGTWWRGWLRAAVAVERGWMWVAPGPACTFCEATQGRRPWLPRRPPPQSPVLLHGEGWRVVVSDSGLADGWGYVTNWEGPVDWQSVAAYGEWQALWARGSAAPGGVGSWHWTGEWVIRAALRAAAATATATATVITEAQWMSPQEVAFVSDK